MKILQIANGDFFSTYGGGQVYVKNLVDEMIRQQLSVVVISVVNKPIEKVSEYMNYNGISLYELNLNHVSEIEALIKKIKPDIIHAHTLKAQVAAIAKENNIPVVVTAHHGGITCPAGTLLNHKDQICPLAANHKDCLACVLHNVRGGRYVYPFFKRIPLKARLKLGRFFSKIGFIYFVTPYFTASLGVDRKINEWKIIVDNVSKVIAPSDAIARNMHVNGMPKEKMEVIIHGIPRPESVTRRVSAPGKLKFFYVGRICHEKGIHILLDAFSRLDPSICELYIIGDDSNKYAQKCKKQYRGHDNLFFLGKVPPEEVAQCIREYDVLVHPTICLEVFGLNIAEALFQQKPVITTRCGGGEMQIRNKKNGLIVEPNNVFQLYETMRYMCANWNQISFVPFKEETLENHVDKLVDVYRNTIAS